jgi:hypothetical protein
VNSIDLFSYCMLLAAACWQLPAATADCCRLQLAAAGLPSWRIIVPPAQTHIPCARISSSQPTTSTPQQQHSPRLSPVLQLSLPFPPALTRCTVAYLLCFISSLTANFLLAMSIDSLFGRVDLIFHASSDLIRVSEGLQNSRKLLQF